MSNNVKEPILHFISSEINSHAAMLIGFSVILFAYLNVIVQQFPTVNLNLCPLCITGTTIQYVVIFVILLFIVLGLVYVTIRLAFYGTLANRTVRHPGKENSIKDMWNAIVETPALGEKKLFKLFPVEWFAWGSLLIVPELFNMFIIVIYFLVQICLISMHVTSTEKT